MAALLGAVSKSFALQLDAGRYAALEPRSGYRAVILRRVMPQITQPGGLWDESQKLYRLMGGKANQSRYEWRWSAWNTKIKFASMQYESDRFAWQGSQLAYIGFDELPHFSQEMFFYMLSRLRSVSGAPRRIRATRILMRIHGSKGSSRHGSTNPLTDQGDEQEAERSAGLSVMVV